MRFLKKLTVLILMIAVLSFIFTPPAAASSPEGQQVVVLRAEGVITAGLAGFFKRQVQEVDPDRVEAIVVLMDTPGGLVDATLDLIRSFNEAEVPIIVFVHPTGAIAASAGAFLILGSDLAVMAPGTTMGAAQPVAMSPEGSAPADDKTTQFLSGHLRSIAEERGRPGDIAERIVTENLTLSASEALEKEAIELIASNMEELLALIDGTELESRGRSFTFDTAGADIVEKEMNVQERLQNWVGDPQISLLLLMVGIMGVYFGLGMPGTFVPEVLGGLLLILGIYGLGLFDTNTAGIVLLLAGFGLLVAEIFTGGFGILGIGGGISIIIGAILLPQEPIMPEGWYGAFRATAIGAGVAVAALSFLVVTVVVRSRRSRKDEGSLFKTPPQGQVVEELNPEGLVRTRGETWRARSITGETVPVGTTVGVEGQEGLLLLVKKPPENEEESSHAGDSNDKKEDNNY